MDQALDHLDRQHGGSTIANSDQGAPRKQYSKKTRVAHQEQQSRNPLS
jgi:hypothetical protein